MSSPKRRIRWLRWVLLLVLLGGAWFGYRWYDQPREQPIDYRTATVARGDITQTVTANGQLSAVKNVQVGSQVSGIITEIHVDFNSRVTNGQIIAQIDPSTYQQTITQSEAELANAKAGWELANVSARRARELRDSALVSAAEYDKALADLSQADAVVKMREALLNKARVDLERTTIYSPIDGVVISRMVDVGQTVAASFNAPTLFTIANDLRNMQIEAMVSEADVGGVEDGQTVRFTVDAFPARPFHGEVIQVRYAPVTNQNVVTYTAVVQVNNHDLKLRPGMTANASIITAQTEGVLRVPNAALRFRPPEGARVLSNAVIQTTQARPSDVSTDIGGPNGAGGAVSGEGGRPDREEMRRRFENMPPEERAQMQERMRGRFGEGGSFARAQGSGSDAPATRTVYLVDSKAGGSTPLLKPVVVQTGISDGSFTEIRGGLQEGDVVVTGINMAQAATAAGGSQRPNSPFGGPFGGGFRR